jgi:plastocyanin
LTNDIDIVEGAHTLTNTAFSPDAKGVALGGAASVAVRFVNLDYDPSNYGSSGVTHHIVSDDGTTFDAGTLAPSHTATINFSATGTIPFHCTIHPNMVGSVVVSP